MHDLIFLITGTMFSFSLGTFAGYLYNHHKRSRVYMNLMSRKLVTWADEVL